MACQNSIYHPETSQWHEEITKPLYHLLKKDTTLFLGCQQNDSYLTLMSILTGPATLHPYNPAKKFILWLIHMKMDCKSVYIKKRSQTTGLHLTISAESNPFQNKTTRQSRESLSQSWEQKNFDTTSLVQTLPAGLTMNLCPPSTTIGKDQHLSAWQNIMITFKTYHSR